MSLTDLMKNGDYLYMLNGESLNGNKNCLTIEKDQALRVIHNVNKKTTLSITVKKGVNASLVEIFNEVKEDVSINLVLESGAILEYTSIRKSDECKNFKIDITLHDNAKLVSKSIGLFSGWVHFDNHINMVGKESEAESIDVVINNSKNKQVFDYETLHKGTLSKSTMRNFVINKNASITFMNTNGIIEKYVKGVVISQKTKGLLLDDASEISANPVLTIDEYDCNASHGASIGAIDEDELYYLMSRGLTKVESEKLIVGGFISPVISSISDEKLKEVVYKIVDEVL